MQEDSIKGRDGAGGLQKGARVQKEGIIKGRDDAGGHFKGEGWYGMRVL